MSHHVYNTEGFVLESASHGEANKTYSLFTRELGRIRASAQGVRLLKSKLRFSLQDYSFVKISLVRGKEFWRITNAGVIKPVHTDFQTDKFALRIVSRIFLLLRRLVPEEEKNEELFEMLSGSLVFLSEHKLSLDESTSAETILVIRVLSILGYMGDTPKLARFSRDPLSMDEIAAMKPVRAEAIREINAALRETQL